MIESPRCEECRKVEYKNRVNIGYIFGDKIDYEHVVMCKECESQQKKVAEDKWGNPIYARN